MTPEFWAGFGTGMVTCSALVVLAAMMLEIRAEHKRERWRRERVLTRIARQSRDVA